MIHSHPAVAEAALIHVPHPKWGEVGRALIVLKPGTSLAEDDLRNWLREQMAHCKVPKSFAFLDALPKTGANKVDRQRLIETHGP